MSTKDEEFMAKLLATFRVEAEEHIKALSNGILTIESTSDERLQKQTIETIFREAHSLKGAARSVNQRVIQEICQILESVLASWKDGKIQGTPQLFDTLHDTVDGLEAALDSGLNTDEADKLIVDLKTYLITSEKAVADDNSEQTPYISEAPLEIPIQSKSSSKLSQEKTIRVALTKLDRLLQQTEEMLMVKLVVQQESSDLKHLLNQFNAHQKEFSRLSSELQSARQGSEDAKLIKRLSRFLDHQEREIASFSEALSKMMKASVQNAHFVGTLVDTLLEDIKKVLMQPMDTLFDVMPRMVRDIAKELGKQVAFEVQGGDIEIDRRILEEIKDPLIHLIRNAIDHGIETPQQREKKGKSPQGTIRIFASETSGGSVELCVSDDGRGFDVEAIRSAAVDRSPSTAKDIASLTDEEAMKLAFHSGISTNQNVTDISGRGLGLGIVSEKTDKLGGHVIIESLPGQGTTFRLILPLTLATFRGIHIEVAKQNFVMPTHNVTKVMRLKCSAITTIENRQVIQFDERPISFVHLADLLNLPNKSAYNASDPIVVLLVKSEEKAIAFGADSILQEQEVLVKNLGKQCVRVRNVMAATIMEGGSVIPILNPVDLVRSAIKNGTTVTRSTTAQSALSVKKRILIAEDSITTRLLLKNILESAGYSVVAVSDGLDALDAIQRESFDLLLTDVEMPRMDGFILTEKLRASAKWKDLPIIICTSKGSLEDREKGLELGADAYLDKSTFNQGTLLAATQKLI